MSDSTTSRSCREFTRAELLRPRATRAGDGLPAIETGMPEPAGTGLSRRSFVLRSSGLALAVFGGSMLSPNRFHAGIEAAQAAAGDRVIVSIFLAGGIDSLTVLAPVGHPRYASLRPSLKVVDSGVAEDVFTEDPSLRWHPSAAPFRDLHRAGKLTVMPTVGYDDANQSHFTSRHYWEVGTTDPSRRVGWMGRYLDRHGSTDNPLQGLSLDWTLAPALAPAGVPVAAVVEPASYGFNTTDVWDARLRKGVMDGWEALGRPATSDPGLAVARQAATMTTSLHGQLAPLQGTDPLAGAAVPYPAASDPFPRRLAAVAEMLESGLPLRCVALTANGRYDTHHEQAASLPKDLDLTARSIAAFQEDLEARGLADRVVTHVWTEFGRRAAENGSGTDHGAAGIGFLIGTRVRGAMVGEFPGLAANGLDEAGNLRHTCDFRAVYRGLLEQWFGADADGLLPDAKRFAPPALIK